MWNDFTNQQIQDHLLYKDPVTVTHCKRAVGYGWAEHASDAFNFEMGESIFGNLELYHTWMCTGGTFSGFLTCILSLILIFAVCTWSIVKFIYDRVAKPMTHAEFHNIPECPESLMQWASRHNVHDKCYVGQNVSSGHKYQVMRACKRFSHNQHGSTSKRKCIEYEKLAQLFTKKNYNGYIQDYEFHKKVVEITTGLLFGVILGLLSFNGYVHYLKYSRVLNTKGRMMNFGAEMMT
jgi:hypothetical protein